MKISFFGAAQTVTGSRFIIEYNNQRVMIDCGLFQGIKEMRNHNWEPFVQAQNIDALVLTHAHIDHSGYIPKLVREGFKGKIFCTESTKALCEILLPDSGRLQEEDARFANMTKHSHHDPALPLYTEMDAIASLRFFHSVSSHQWHELLPGLRFQLLRAGHILGSSLVQISAQVDDKQKLITFSGDIGNGRSLVIKDPEIIKETDVLVLESTYGDRVQSHKDPQESFAQVILKVLGRGGTLIIPAFALGRTQEIIHIIHCLEETGRIPIFPVYLDSPMASSVTNVYSKINGDIKLHHGETEPVQFTTKNFRIVSKSEESMMLCMDQAPKIVISAAGMLTGGRVMHHLKAQLPRLESGVLFVGYQAEGTKGLLLKNGFKTIRIHHREIQVEAEIFSIDSLSAHADSNDLVHWVNRMEKKPSQTFLVHGEGNALRTLKYRLSNEAGLQNIDIPTHGQSFDL